MKRWMQELRDKHQMVFLWSNKVDGQNVSISPGEVAFCPGTDDLTLPWASGPSAEL